MEIKRIILAAILGTLLIITLGSCINNNNKDNNESQGRTHESDYENEAPTYNKTRDDMEERTDTISNEKRIPKDSVEIKSKGNASSV